MAMISHLYMHDFDINSEDSVMTVYAKFKSVGDVQLRNIPIPASFKKALLDLAQAAVDKKQAELQAEVLGDNNQPPATKARGDL